MHKPTILIVDDEEYIAELLSELLVDELECEVISALNGASALALARQHLPTLVITDLMMPRMDGRAFVRSLRADARFNEVPIITMSAARQKPQWVEDEEFLFIAKPFETDELIRVVRGLLETADDG